MTSGRARSFAVCSLPRSGSTALFRALSLDGYTRILYEPDFGDRWRSERALHELWLEWSAEFRGIKHVWDPNGWPFANPLHQSTPESLSRSGEWIATNAALLGNVPKIIFLRRRNVLARTLSDLLGQQTDLWGHQPEQPHSAREAVDYRTQLSMRRLVPLDERVIDWYLRESAGWEDQIVARIPSDRIFQVHYEDVFGPEVDLPSRVRRIAELAQWLEVPLRLDDARLQAVLEPASKLNDRSSYVRIPNFASIVEKFGEV